MRHQNKKAISFSIQCLMCVSLHEGDLRADFEDQGAALKSVERTLQEKERISVPDRKRRQGRGGERRKKEDGEEEGKGGRKRKGGRQAAEREQVRVESPVYRRVKGWHSRSRFPTQWKNH